MKRIVRHSTLMVATLLFSTFASATFTYAAERIVVQGVGLSAPESIVHDEQYDVYLVSNVNGRAIDNDENGFISRLSPDGRVIELKWIDGQSPGVTLHAPKGLTISGNLLFVADNGDEQGNVVRLFDLETGKPVGTVPIPGSQFLNGLATLASGDVVVTDSAWHLSLTDQNSGAPLALGERQRADGSTWTPTGRDAVYRIAADDHQVSVLAHGPVLFQPNGIAVLPSGNLLTVSSNSGQLYELTPDGRKVNVRPLPDRGFDGAGVAADGRIFVAGPEKLYVLQPDGDVQVVPGIDTHVADLNFDFTRNRLLLPLLRADQVIIETLAKP